MWHRQLRDNAAKTTIINNQHAAASLPSGTTAPAAIIYINVNAEMSSENTARKASGSG